MPAAVSAIKQAIDVLGDKSVDREAQSSQKADLSEVLEKYKERSDALELYTEAYRRYCWDVKSLDDYKIAPFHILTTEGKSWLNENHVWHMQTIAKYMTTTDIIFMATNHLIVDLLDENSVATAIKWWEDLTASGG